MTTNASISSQVIELIKQMGDEPFAARQLQDKLGLGKENCHAVSGTLTQLYKHNALEREISQEHRGYSWWVIDREALNNYKFRMSPSAGGDGARPSKYKPLVIPTKPLHERLWELAIELSEGAVDLSEVPMENLIAELSRRMPK